MSNLPSFEDPSIDVHAPASTYYTTGDNARHRTRTYTVSLTRNLQFSCLFFFNKNKIK